MRNEWIPTLINYPSWSIRCSNYITVSMLSNMLVSSSTGPNIILSHVIINPNYVDWYLHDSWCHLLSLFPPSRSTHAVARIWSWCRPKKEDWLKKKDRNQRRPGCGRKKLWQCWVSSSSGPQHCHTPVLVSSCPGPNTGSCIIITCHPPVTSLTCHWAGVVW